jgi:hypothetical protein
MSHRETIALFARFGDSDVWDEHANQGVLGFCHGRRLYNRA